MAQFEDGRPTLAARLAILRFFNFRTHFPEESSAEPIVFSHSGKVASDALSVCPSKQEFRIETGLFRTLILERLRLLVRVTENVCECWIALDSTGRHRAACSRSLRLKTVVLRSSVGSGHHSPLCLCSGWDGTAGAARADGAEHQSSGGQGTDVLRTPPWGHVSLDCCRSRNGRKMELEDFSFGWAVSLVAGRVSSNESQATIVNTVPVEAWSNKRAGTTVKSVHFHDRRLSSNQTLVVLGARSPAPIAIQMQRSEESADAGDCARALFTHFFGRPTLLCQKTHKRRQQSTPQQHSSS